MAGPVELPSLDSLTNSVMMAMEKELRKYGVAIEYHRHYTGNREIFKGMLGIMLYEEKDSDDTGK